MTKREGKKWADMSPRERFATIALIAVLGLIAGVIVWIALGALMIIGQFVWEGVNL